MIHFFFSTKNNKMANKNSYIGIKYFNGVIKVGENNELFAILKANASRFKNFVKEEKRNNVTNRYKVK